MQIKWSSAARRDLVRLHDFLKPVNPRVAAQTVSALLTSVERLLDYPEVAPLSDTYEGRNVRSVIIGDYNLHYEVTPDVIFVVRIWHTREDR
ncbi:MAG TPA: type II toxin-antitoxin system RelE/ParE family toxin [Asticcacaulis sp.]|nr:type II toxin-antitoxin system RelE/ParE family toxin [Asticcacaulis sp.]